MPANDVQRAPGRPHDRKLHEGPEGGQTMSHDGISSMTAKELKHLVTSAGMSLEGCFEKELLLDLAKEAQAKLEAQKAQKAQKAEGSATRTPEDALASDSESDADDDLARVSSKRRCKREERESARQAKIEEAEVESSDQEDSDEEEEEDDDESFITSDDESGGEPSDESSEEDHDREGSCSETDEEDKNDCWAEAARLEPAS